MARSAAEMRESVIRDLEKTTGKDLAAWLELIRWKAPREETAMVRWLKGDHGIGHVTAQIIAAEATRPPAVTDPGDAERIERQYAGPRKVLRRILDELVWEARKLGDDVNVHATSRYVAFSRIRQFAIVVPSSGGRVDLGLVLPTRKPTKRLRHVNRLGGSERVTHVVSLTAPGEIDSDVREWLRTAYDQDIERRREKR